MKKILLLVLITNLFLGYSQDLSNYKNIEAKGVMPKDLLTYSSDKFESDVEREIDNDDKRSTKKAKELFLLKSSFQLREMLYSGKVIFNDTLSTYITRVADKVLENDPSLKGKIRFYILKSSAVNGFATNDGMIFITMGLLSQLENEAQLAYVLTHEIAHYKKKHVINKYVENTKIQRSSTYRTSQDAMIKSNKYSKELETEADLEGYKLFEKSNYKKKGVERVFDVLKYSYLPFDEIKFDTTLFQSGGYVFPSDYWVDEVNEIAVSDDYDEDKSSHPSPDTRKATIKNLISKNADASKGSYYKVVDEAYFKYIRNVSRFELAKILLKEHQYKKAIYHIFLLQNEFKDNEYLDQMMNFALYYEFRSNISSDYSLINENSSYSQEGSIEGESHRVFYWIEEMTTEELGILALKKSLENEVKYTNNVTFKNLSFDLMYLLSRDFDVSFETFVHSHPSSDSTVEKSNNETLSKIDKINNKSQSIKAEEYYKYALVDVFKTNKTIEERFFNAMTLGEKTIEEFDARVNKTGKERRKIRRNGHAFGIDKMVVVSPDYNKINLNKKQPISYGASEEALLDLNKEIKESATKAKLDVEVLDDLSFESNDIDKFNNFVMLNAWLEHSSRFLENADTSFFVPLDAGAVENMIANYNTDYFCWTGFTSIKERKDDIAARIIISTVAFYTMPFTIAYIVTPKYVTSYYSIVFNLKTKKAVWGMSEEFGNKDTKSNVRAMLFDTFYQLNQTK